jgi:hypothetical protein
LGAYRAERDQGAGRLLLEHDVVAVVVQARSAVRLGYGDAQYSERAELVEELARQPARVLPLRVVGDHLLGHEVPDELPERFVVGGEEFSAHDALREGAQDAGDTSSTRVALAVPPPSHMVCRP